MSNNAETTSNEMAAVRAAEETIRSHYDIRKVADGNGYVALTARFPELSGAGTTPWEAISALLPAVFKASSILFNGKPSGWEPDQPAWSGQYEAPRIGRLLRRMSETRFSAGLDGWENVERFETKEEAMADAEAIQVLRQLDSFRTSPADHGGGLTRVDAWDLMRSVPGLPTAILSSTNELLASAAVKLVCLDATVDPEGDGITASLTAFAENYDDAMAAIKSVRQKWATPDTESGVRAPINHGASHTMQAGSLEHADKEFPV